MQDWVALSTVFIGLLFRAFVLRWVGAELCGGYYGFMGWLALEDGYTTLGCGYDMENGWTWSR